MEKLKQKLNKLGIWEQKAETLKYFQIYIEITCLE